MSSDNKKPILSTDDTRQRAALLLSFVLPVSIVLSIFVAKGIYPFGDRSFLYSDMYHQYMPFFSEFLRAIKAGQGLNYSWNVGIGSNFLALYVYYLASPLHWLAFLVPESHLMEFMSYLVIVKLGLCGLTSFRYLQKHFETQDGAVLLFSSFYALSGFIAAYNWNIMWLDCVILLPLIMLGLERLVKEGRCGLYCLTLTLSILTNYYISIMICIFLVLYFIVLLITEKRSFRIVVDFALYSLLAGGIASVLLIPELSAILATDFGDVSFPDTLVSYFPVLDELARHCLAVSTERGLDHWPNIYCGVAVFFLLPMYVLNQNIPIRKRFCNLVLVGIFLFSFATNVMDLIWHGMNYPDSLPARQSFIYILLVITMCYDVYRNIKETSERQILYGYLCAAVFLLACERFIQHEDFDTGIELLTLLFVTIYAVLLYLYRTKDSARTKCFVGALALVAVIAELVINSYNTSFGTTSRSAYLGQQEDYKALYEYTKDREESFYRVEKFTRKTKNDGTLAGYPSASLFSSTMNSNVMDLYTILGMRHSKVYYSFDGATALTAALFNVEYMFGDSDKYENPLYTLLEKSREVYLYENRETLPFGYVAPYGYDLPEGIIANPILLQNKTVQTLGIDENLFTRVSGEPAGDSVRIKAEKNGIYYAMLTASGTKEVELVGGELELESYSDLKDHSVLYLGYLMTGDTVTLRNGDEDDETPKISVDAYYMNVEVLERALALLSQNHMENVTYESGFVSGDITLAEAGRVILSVPYEKGWTVTVNGQKTECALFGGALIALDLEPGTYHIELHNVPAGKALGIRISVVCVILFVVMSIYHKRVMKRKGYSGYERKTNLAK
ncbi:MAG: YfhO family protein [Acetatifactor sp.]|nr:YfhO family protein [Acetatifactor sp.]